MDDLDDMDDTTNSPPAGDQATSENGTTGRDRLMRALRRPGGRGQITAAILLAVVGFASVVQVQSNEQDDSYEGARQEDLIQLLNSLSAASQRAENELAQLEQTRSSLRNDTDSRQAALEQARQQETVLGILAGTIPAVGPGIIVTVEDPKGGVGIDQLLNGLEELRNAGAEAIEINDSIRVIAQTSLEDGDSGILVDGRPIAPPYTIEVIGNAPSLATALEFPQGFIAEVERFGGSVAVEEASSVEIATVREPRQPVYAEPVEPE